LLDSQRGLPKNLETYVRGKFDRFVMDFVICHTDTFKVVAVIELDDPSHDAKQAIREELPYDDGSIFAKPPVEAMRSALDTKPWEELF
jgi:hypothetical protein